MVHTQQQQEPITGNELWMISLAVYYTTLLHPNSLEEKVKSFTGFAASEFSDAAFLLEKAKREYLTRKENVEFRHFLQTMRAHATREVWTDNILEQIKEFVRRNYDSIAPMQFQQDLVVVGCTNEQECDKFRDWLLYKR